MSHMIYGAEKGLNASVFVVKQPAWHGLGKVLANPATAEEAIVAAQLDFQVVKQPIFLGDGTGIPNRFATVRTDTNTPLGVVSGRYEVLPNRDAFKFFDAVVDADEAVYHSAGVLGNGERVWVMAKMPDHISIAGVDDTNVYVTLLSGHDGKTGVMAFVHLERIVCNNTLQIALGQARSKKKLVRFRHDTGVIARVADGATLLGIVNEYRRDIQGVFGQMAQTKVDDSYKIAFVEALFPALPKDVVEKMKRTPSFEVYRGQVLEAIEAGAGQDMVTTKGTAFGLYNGVTFWLDNVKNGYGNASKKQNSIWFGESSNIRQRAFDLLNYDTSELSALANVIR